MHSQLLQKPTIGIGWPLADFAAPLNRQRAIRLFLVVAFAAVAVNLASVVTVFIQVAFASQSSSAIGVGLEFTTTVSTLLYLFAGIGLVALVRPANGTRFWLGLICLGNGLFCVLTSVMSPEMSQFQSPIFCWGLVPVCCLVLGLRANESHFELKHIVFFLTGVVCLVLWGKHGDLEFVRELSMRVPGVEDFAFLSAGASGAPGWVQASSAFVGGFIAVVVLPCLFVKFILKARLRDFGLSIPRRQRTRILFWSMLYLIVGAIGFYYAAADPAIQSIYPYVRSFPGWQQFLMFELSALLFYASVEFIFRGYILFGVERILSGGMTGDRKWAISAVAVLASAIPYIVWHLDKPTPELIGAMIWASAAGVSAVWLRSVLHLIVVHWIWNVWLDLCIMNEIGVCIGC